MKKINILVIAILGIILFSLTTCFSDYEGGKGNIKINFNNSSARQAGGDATYIIILTNEYGEVITETATGSTVLRVTPGKWTVEVRREVAGVLEHYDLTTTEVRMGKTNTAELDMQAAVEISDITDGSFSNTHYILLKGEEITVNDSITIDTGKTHTLIPVGNVKITRSYEDNPFKGNFFMVAGTLTLGAKGMTGTLIIDGLLSGNDDAYDSIITISGGELNMYPGVILKNNEWNTPSDNKGGGVFVGTGTFTMHGGTISGNKIFTNSGVAYGGGVFVDTGGTFIMYDGTISGNKVFKGTGVAKGGGVYVDAGGTFNEYGGEISDNTANGEESNVHIE
ncbi:MAG: hypothetical protein LBU88_09620 [Treponema sp.]|jgi:hypothetical protein|nr:hypothetical protein [Treponema sp.]